MKCNACGAQLSEGARFCSQCGKAFPETDGPAAEAVREEASPEEAVKETPSSDDAQKAIPREVSNAPLYEGGPPAPDYTCPQQKDAEEVIHQPALNIQVLGPETRPLSVGAFLGMMLLMFIPIANLVLLFVWAFGKTNANRQNYARAALLLLLISVILSLVVSCVFFFTLGSYIGNLL